MSIRLHTTAKLVATDNASQARVIGGIWVNQASIPTGIPQVAN
jgi:hypothetical protein